MKSFSSSSQRTILSNVIDALYTRKEEGEDEDVRFVAAHVATIQSGGEGGRREVIYNRPHRSSRDKLENRGVKYWKCYI
jgi:hypothetical protein